MSLSATDVSRIARLARLHMDESEIAAVQGQLNGIFGLIEAMQAVDTTGVAPMSHPQDVSLRLRDDVVSESDRRAAYQAVASSVENGLYLVPKVIE
jgi:aspartyl-tRNA(Asn)/glutamyl-tRNA(Gln) amidotransferase subunit C